MQILFRKLIYIAYFCVVNCYLLQFKFGYIQHYNFRKGVPFLSQTGYRNKGAAQLLQNCNAPK